MNDLIDTTEMYLRTVFELEEEGVVPLRARIAERLGMDPFAFRRLNVLGDGVDVVIHAAAPVGRDVDGERAQGVGELVFVGVVLHQCAGRVNEVPEDRG